MKKLAFFLLLPILAFAQGQSGYIGGGQGVSITTVGGLANVAHTIGTPAIVTDASTSSDCTVGGGATLVLCRWGGAAWGPFPAGTATPGGLTTQLQFNNSGALGGISGWTTNGSTTITAGATSVLDLSASGPTTGFKLPSAVGAAPTADSLMAFNTTTHLPVWGSNASTVTLPTSLGVVAHNFLTSYSAATGAFTQAQPACADLSTSSGGCSMSTTAAGDLSGTLPTASVVGLHFGATGITLGTAPTSGQFLGYDGANIVGLSGLSNPMTTLGDVISGGTAGAPARLAGPTATNGVAQFLTSTPSAGAATAPAWAPAGVSGRAVTATSDTIAATDRAAWVTYNAATAVGVNLAQAGTTGFASNFVFGVKNLGAGAVTITPAVGSTIDGNATLVVTQGQNCSITSLDNTNYVSRCSSGQVTAGSGISITPSASGIAIASTSSGGTVTTTGSPASGQPTAFSGATSITTATAHNLETVLVCSDSSASGTAKNCTTSPSFTPAANDCVIFVSTTNNTGALTWNVNALGTTAVKKWLGTALASGDIVANKPVLGCYDGTNWDVEDIGNAPSGGGGTAFAWIQGWCIGTFTAAQTNGLVGLGASSTGCTSATWGSNSPMWLSTGTHTLSRLHVTMGTSKTGNTYPFTIWKAACTTITSGACTAYGAQAATALTCTVSGNTASANQTCSDTTDTVSVAEFDIISVKWTTVASDSAGNASLVMEVQ